MKMDVNALTADSDGKHEAKETWHASSHDELLKQLRVALDLPESFERCIEVGYDSWLQELKAKLSWPDSGYDEAVMKLAKRQWEHMNAAAKSYAAAIAALEHAEDVIFPLEVSDYEGAKVWIERAC